MAAGDGCLFCRIIAGHTPSLAVFGDDISLAFLDRRPLFPGHCLLVPREHHETLDDLPDALVGPLFSRAKLLALAVQEGLGAEGTFVAINNRVSQSVPHLHIHIVPRRKDDGLKGFFWPRRQYADEGEARRSQEAIRSALARLQGRGSS
mgnify:CR=1 FL=1